jgi:hypothetical protein
MEPGPFSESCSRLATREFPNILWNPKARYRVHKSPLTAPVLSQIDPVHSTSPCSSKIHDVLVSLVVSFLLAFTLDPCKHSYFPMCPLFPRQLILNRQDELFVRIFAGFLRNVTWVLRALINLDNRLLSTSFGAPFSLLYSACSLAGFANATSRPASWGTVNFIPSTGRLLEF